MAEFKLDFNLDCPTIKLRAPATQGKVLRAERELGTLFPSSYKWWLTQYADGADVYLANSLYLFPLLEADASVWGSVIGQTKWWLDWEVSNLEDLVVFGMGGVDSETFALYTGCMDDTGEYPIIWITPGSADTKGYVLLNSRFDRFLNIQLHFLFAHSVGDLNQEDGDRLWRNLYLKYDPITQIPTSDFYLDAVTADEVGRQAARLIENRHG